jgi:hypothetical protein
MEDNQVELRASIEESRRLTEKAQELLNRHRDETEARDGA